MNDIDPRLKKAFDEHGQGVRVVADLAERAIARNRSNRRRELGIAALGAGLVLAVAVPLTWSSVGINRSSPLPIGPTQPTSAPTTVASPPPSTPPSTSPSTRPSTIGRTPNGSSDPTAIPTLRSTGAPGAAELQPATGPVTDTTDVGYVVDGVFHEGKRQIRLPAAFRVANTASVLGDGLLVGAANRVVVLNATGQVVRDLPALQGPIIVAPDRSHALVTDSGGNLLYLDSTGKQVGRLAASKGGPSGWQAAALAGEMAYGLVSDQTRTVAWDVRTGRTTMFKGSIGPVDDAGRRAIVTASLSPGQPGFGCQRLVDLPSNRTIWNLCGPLWFTSFSPDGSFLLGHGYSDGQPPELFNGANGKPLYQEFVVARTADARVVLQGGGDGSTPTGWVQSSRFGADGSIAAVIGVADQQRNLQRCRLDGRCEVVGAAGPSYVPGEPGSDAPYVLAGN